MHELSVYYDGACHLCSREIEHYMKKETGGRVRYVDIAAPGFNAAAEGLDRERVQREMHVKLASGEIKTAVQAFVHLWQVLPGYGWAAKLASNPVILPVLSAGYHVFARLRPYLPKRHRDACDNGVCVR